MRLSRLHINGFKSFADRAELSFDDGVTAIVGPNGCGKSNVVDAITWVLGEQSAKSLRGDRMEDIMFNGSDARKPTASAEVRLRLANVAYAAMESATEANGTAIIDPALGDNGQLPLVTRDVEIGRRLYRSGESEYLIDGEVCRLRDVHDLLMDSGLGIKAYAVIEQGKIGQILSSRPAERRALIEEAAGVTKYKHRRRAAELKLDAARQNLLRVDDIVFEVEKQRSALKRQAARARRYKRLREELRRWEQVQFAHRHAALTREIDTAHERLSDARLKETAAAARVAELESLLEALRLELTDAERHAIETREQAHQRELEIGRNQQQIAFDRQQVEDLGHRLDQLRDEAQDLEARRAPAQEAIDAHRTVLDRARTALQEAQGTLEEREHEYQRALAAVQGVEHDADQTRAVVMAATTTLTALRQARDNATAARDRVAEDRSRLDVELRDLQQEADRAARDRKEAERALTNAREASALALQARTDAENALAHARDERDRLSQFLSNTHRELARLGARLQSISELDRKRTTFGDAARFLLSEAPETVGQHGAFADHLRVEPSFERAVDALIGDLLQHVVVDRTEQVREALDHLEERKAGRCGFLVIDDAKQAPARTPAAATAGARALGDVVTATGPYADLIVRALPDAFVVESFVQAQALALTTGVPVATLDGDVFRGAGLVEGGARGGFLGILETRAEAQALKEEVQTVERAAHQSANDVTAADLDILNGETEVVEKQQAQHDLEKAIVSHQAQLDRATDELTRVSRRIELVTTERRRCEEDERAADERRQAATLAIEAHESGQVNAEQSLSAVMARLLGARSDAELHIRRVSEARVAESTITERVQFLESEGRRLEEGAADLAARLSARRDEIERTDGRRTQLRDSISSTERTLDDNVRLLEALRSEMRGFDDTVSGLRGRFSEKEHEIRLSRHALEAVRAEVMQSEVVRATAQADITHLAAACMESLNLVLADVVAEVARMERDGELAAPAARLAAASAPDVDEEMPELADMPEMPELAEVTARPETAVATESAEVTVTLSPDDVIADLKQKIDRLGPVNMMAIEQFDELESRHLFLTTQRKDLLDSIAQTSEAIKRIDVTTRVRFQEAFTTINTYFEGTFTTLFGGGRAGLVLIDQENQIESGIDIIAQPPGKRLQNVQLLSGGEKALTAMALMFAVFKYRPSPFCLLDEIDAPLDDANIGRFVEMLQGMQEHTQFILITHNRKTMEIADRLYGVTMEEPGVSKLISVQLH
jgi:chromosome segregation protein